MAEQKTPMDHVNAYWNGKLPHSPIYNLLLSDVVFTEATNGSVVIEMDVMPVHLNSNGSVHGSVSATIIDWAGGMAIASTGAEKTGVSTDIHASYAGGAKVGDRLRIEAKVSKLGRRLAYTTVEIRRMRDDAVVCTGLHTKFVG